MALTIVGLATLQPPDQTYVSENAPYLDRGLGGFGPGAAAELNLLTGARISAALEVSTGSVSAVQHGRLVGGTAQGCFQETLVSALVGVATPSRNLQLLSGLSRLIGTPTLNGVAIKNPDATHLAFTAGVEAAWPLGQRTALVAHGRYSITAQTDAAAQIGVGNQIIRGGVGLRLLLARW